MVQPNGKHFTLWATSKIQKPNKSKQKIAFDQEQQQQQMLKFFRNFLKAVVHIV